MAGKQWLAGALVLALVASVTATVYFEETFSDKDWEKRWVKSSWKQDDGLAGDWEWTAGKYHGAAEDKGIQTNPDARFFAIAAGFDSFSNEGKDLVLQFSVKNEQDLKCGGGYIKLIGGNPDLKKFDGDTPYAIMFGPDVCGMTKRVHVIITYNDTNHLIKKEIQPADGQLTHVYTLILKPDNSYSVLIDNEEKQSGSLKKDWDFLPPKKIKDPNAVKPPPEEWDERAKIPDPEDKKPEGFDDIPAKIVDPEATKPEDWDDEEDGEWEPPIIDNPEYKGEWKPKMIDNPDFKGVWKAPLIDNPEYVEDDKIYAFKDLTAVGFELWQVEAGTIFDNILVTDDVDYAKKFALDTWGKIKDAEKEMFDAQEKEKAEAAKEDAPEEEDEEEEEEGDSEPEDSSHDEL